MTWQESGVFRLIEVSYSYLRIEMRLEMTSELTNIRDKTAKNVTNNPNPSSICYQKR